MAVNGSAASGRFAGAELVIDPIGTVFEPLEHSPALSDLILFLVNGFFPKKPDWPAGAKRKRMAGNHERWSASMERYDEGLSLLSHW
jgi:hypothetical protein